MHLYKYPRIFLRNKITQGAVIEGLEEKCAHICGSLRRRAGDYLRVFNENDGEWLATISEIRKKSIILQIERGIRSTEIIQSELYMTYITLFCPVISQQKTLLTQSVELGMSKYIPIRTQRSQYSKINMDKVSSYLVSATEQSERLDIPEVHNKMVQLSDIETIDDSDILLFATELGGGKLLKHIDFSRYKKISVVVGPEGGFTKTEISILSNIKHSYPVSLGANILKTETASASILSGIAHISDYCMQSPPYRGEKAC